jgi:uncharacterized membrane protein HdeD (DUF308 family)
MTEAANIRPSLGHAIHAISGKWGWFVALGVADLILGGIASTNLFAANLVSVLFIGAAILAAGILQIVHAFMAGNIRGFLFWLLGGVMYGAAGAIILYDPILASLSLSLAAGIFLVLAGIFRTWAGFHTRPAAGWPWIVVAGILTICVGAIVIATWPGISLWFLGAMLVVDLIFQGWGFIAFGFALKARASRHPTQPAANPTPNPS